MKYELKTTYSANPISTRSTILVCCLLAALVTAVFWQVVRFEFVNFDDPIYITENTHIKQGLNLETVRWAFTTHLHGHFHPLTWLAHAGDYLLFGLDPAGHHFSGFLLHLLNTLLLFIVLRKMTGATWTSGFAAALFAIHPLHVESVAWVADRKDLLCGFFWILSLYIYTRAVEKRSYWLFLLLMLTYFLGLLSKTMMITLPLILLLLDFWPLQRIGTLHSKPGHLKIPPSSLAQILFEKLGLLLIAGFFVYLSTTAMQDLQVESKTLSPYWQYDFLLFFRHYLEKFVWPLNLTVFYPYQENPAVILLVQTGAFLLLFTVIAILLRRRFPYLLTGWLWFCITLVPVAGIVHGGPHRVADRYTYIPLIGLIIALAWAGSKISFRGRRWAESTGAVAVTLLLFLSVLSYTQTGRWQESLTLFKHAVNIYPNNWIAHNNLGDALDKDGRIDEAIFHYQKALQLKPDYAKANYNMGNALASLGRQDEALRHFKTAIVIYPEFAEAHNNAGVLLAQQKRYLEAKQSFAAALALKPDYQDAIVNMHDISSLVNELEEKIIEYQDGLLGNPDNAKLHSNLGLLYREGGEADKAEHHFREALRIKPDFAGAHNNLGILFAERGNYEAAAHHFQQAVELNPDFTGARSNLQRIRTLLDQKK